MISRIFKVDTSPECNTMATELATLFSDTQAPKRHLVQVNDFYKNRKNPFFTFVTREWQKQKAKELQALFFLEFNRVEESGFLYTKTYGYIGLKC